MSKLCCLLPIEFDNDLCISDYTGMCSCCGKGIPSTHIEADIHRWSRHVVMVRGTGECPHCGESTEIHVYAHDDLSVRQLIKGEWVSSCGDSSLLTHRSSWGLFVAVILVVSALLVIVSLAQQKRALAQLVYCDGHIYSLSDHGYIGEDGKIYSFRRNAVQRLL